MILALHRLQTAGFFFAFPPSPIFRKMAQGTAQFTKKIAELARDNTQENKLRADVLGNVGQSLSIRLRGARNVVSDSSPAYLRFSAMMLEFTVFPHAPCHQHAGTSGSKSQRGAWKWVAQQVRDDFRTPIGRTLDSLIRSVGPSRWSSYAWGHAGIRYISLRWRVWVFRFTARCVHASHGLGSLSRRSA